MSWNWRALILTLLTVSAAVLVGCGPDKSSNRKVVFSEKVFAVTKENYLSGKDFCAKFSDITSKEHGRYVQVPVDYKDSSKGTLEIYTWTNKPFDPKLPSFVYFNGGPGQNGHGRGDFMSLPESVKAKMDPFESGWNQINIDQRGLGCSAPNTFEQYKDHTLYSSMNTIHDAEKVRQAFGIAKWTVFGISYGTVPATMYASVYPKKTNALVLEGIVFDYSLPNHGTFMVEKLNAVLDKLTPEKKKGFNNFLTKDETHTNLVVALVSDFLYANGGFLTLHRVIDKLIVSEDEIDNEYLKYLFKYQEANADDPSKQQSPGEVDKQVFGSIYCKELGAILPILDFEYDEKMIRFFTTMNYEGSDYCKNLGINKNDQHLYESRSYPVSVHTTYFQGTHDGATLAQGSIDHWKTTAIGTSQLLLKTRGGHNPISSAMRLWEPGDDEEPITIQQVSAALLFQDIFQIALVGKSIDSEKIERMNTHMEPGQEWFSPEKNIAGFNKINQGLQHIKMKK